MDLGRTSLVEHTIELIDPHVRPVKSLPRRVPLAKRAAVDAKLDHLLQLGVIERSSSPWCAPISVVEWKSGGQDGPLPYHASRSTGEP